MKEAKKTEKKLKENNEKQQNHYNQHRHHHNKKDEEEQENDGEEDRVDNKKKNKHFKVKHNKKYQTSNDLPGNKRCRNSLGFSIFFSRYRVNFSPGIPEISHYFSLTPLKSLPFFLNFWQTPMEISKFQILFSFIDTTGKSCEDFVFFLLWTTPWKFQPSICGNAGKFKIGTWRS